MIQLRKSARWAAVGVIALAPLASAPAASADPPYSSCAQARADGRSNIPQGDPGYSSKLDRDHDGIACES